MALNIGSQKPSMYSTLYKAKVIIKQVKIMPTYNILNVNKVLQVKHIVPPGTVTAVSQFGHVTSPKWTVKHGR